MFTRSRYATALLVHLLWPSLLLGQEQVLTQPVAVSSPAPVQQRPVAAAVQTAAAPPSSKSPEAVPAAPAPHDETPSSDAASPASTIEPQYFSGQLGGSYPVSVPRGRGGMTPSIVLDYHSGDENGWLGTGWELEMGAIERQSRSGVDYGSEKYVFRSSQGAETLVQQGPDKSQFATEIASRFELFQQHKAADGQNYWTMTDTQGNVREYGTTAASRLANPGAANEIFSWRLTRITDTLGNSIVLTYFTDTASNNLYLQTIRYAESPGLQATNTVTFDSELRPDIETSWQLGFKVQTRYRLARISVTSGGHAMPGVQLSYGNAPSSATGRSLLRSISIVPADASAQLPPTQYRYQENALLPVSPTRTGGPVPKDTLDKQCMTGDFNGDSLTDIACYSGANGVWSMTLSSKGDGWTTNAIAGPAPGIANQQCMVADMNGDGKSDLLCYTLTGRQWHRMLGNATGWGSSDTVLASAPALPVSDQCVTGDMNGDGRADIACSLGGTNWEWSLSQGDVFAPSITVKGPDVGSNPKSVGRQCIAADFDADNRTDMACYPDLTGSKAGTWYRGISSGSAWNTTSVPGPISGSPIHARCLFADLNGDRRTDILCYAGSGTTGNQWYGALATPSGFDSAFQFLGPQTSSSATNNCVAMDVNGDGKADLTCHEGTNTWQTFVSASVTEKAYTGTEMVNGGTWTGPATVAGFALLQQCAVGDFNGDGKGDFACHKTNDSWQMFESDGITPDLMSRSTTIFGGTTSFEYSHAAMTDQASVPVPIDVVTRTTTDDGTGRTAATNIKYSSGYFHVRQRDFHGFRRAEITGPRTDGVGATTVLRYHQGSSAEFNSTDASDDQAYMRGRLDQITILNEKGQKMRQNTFVYAASSAIPRFNPLVQMTGIVCENDVCTDTLVVREYDAFGNVTKVQDYGDRTTAEDDVTSVITYAYNEAKHMVSYPSSEEVLAGIPGAQRLSYSQFFYDSSDTCAKASTNTVPARGLVTRVVRWVGSGAPDVEERIAFDDAGNVVCKADPLGNRTTFTYDASKEFPVAVDNALSQRTTVTYYGVANQPLDHGLYGLLRSITDPNGAVATTQWDSFGRRTKTTNPGGLTVDWSYPDLGTPLKQALRTASGGLSTTAILDGFGRPVKTRRSGPQLKFIVTDVRFNERGLSEATSLPYFEGEASPGEMKVVYDAMRRPVDQFDAAGGRRTICYSSGATDVIDENGHRTRKLMTATGRVLRVLRYKGVFGRDCSALTLGQPYSVTQYRYDAVGRLTQIIDPKGIATSITWDGLDRRTKLVDSAVGERQFSFDAAGNETAWQSSSGSAVFIQYDALGRPLQKDYFAKKALGSGDVVNSYDAGTNGIGRLTGTKNASATRLIAYDRAGRPISINHVIGGATYHEGRAYDTLGRVTEITYPSGRVVTQVYDGPTLANVHGPAGTEPYASFTNFNAAGFPASIRYGNGLTTELEYETPKSSLCPRPTYRLCRTRTLASDLSVDLRIRYDYDPKGNIVSATEPNVVHSYIYDELDRLLGVATSPAAAADAAYRGQVLNAEFPRDWAALSAPSSAIRLEEGFSYDKSDDLTWKFDVGPYTYPDASAAAMNPHAPRSAGSETFSWDRDGNMIFSPGRAMAYDVEGRLVAVDFFTRRHAAPSSASLSPRSIQYEYDSDGSRVRESSPRGTTVFIGALSECTPGGCVDHVFAGSQRIASIGSGNSVAYYHQDAVNSTRLVSDGLGTYTRLAYSAHGIPSAANGSLPNFLQTIFLFGDQPYASDAGIYLFSGRAYDPHIGRFLSPDEIVPVAGSPQHLNRYAYALNNPASFIDPDGHFPFLFAIIGLIIGAIIGGVVAQLSGGNWLQGAIIGALTGARIAMGDPTAAFENLAVGIATGAVKGAVTAVFTGEKLSKGIRNGVLDGVSEFAADSFSTIGDDLFGADTNAFGDAAKKFTNDVARSTALGGWKAVLHGKDLRAGARGGLISGVQKEVSDAASGVVGKSLKRAFGMTVKDDDKNGEFVCKTPFFGNLENDATTIINASLTPARQQPDDNWMFVQAYDATYGAPFSPPRALATGIGASWGTVLTETSNDGAVHP